MDWIKVYAMLKNLYGTSGSGGSGGTGGSGAGCECEIYASQEYVDGKVSEIAGLPEGATAYQQLVTDSEGNAVWEDRTHYKNDKITVKLSPTFDVPTTAFSAKWVGGTASNDPAQVAAAKDVLAEMTKCAQGASDKWVFFFDGVRVESPIRRFPLIWTINSVINGTDTIPFAVSINTMNAENPVFEIYYDDDNEHTFGFELVEPELKQLSEDFIPSSVPVIQSAEVGQTVVVKAVDADGKPTEWKAVSVGGSSSWNDLTDKPFGDIAAGELVEDFYAETAVNEYHPGLYYSREVPDPSNGYNIDWQNTSCLFVNHNGVDYKASVCYGNLGGMYYFVGNASMIFSDMPDTGEPFLWFRCYGEPGLLTTTPGEHTLTVNHIAESTLPLKYLAVEDYTDGEGGVLCGHVINGALEGLYLEMGNAVLKIYNAEPGQVVTVKSVNDYGEPIEWEAVDMGSLGEVTDEHINALIDAKIAAIPSAEEASF